MTEKKENTYSLNSTVIKTVLIILVLIFVNVITSNKFFRLDLTSEKRYTLSKETKEILHNLKDLVHIRIYLDGDLNIPLKYFQKSITELLDEFSAYAGGNLDFELIDPIGNADPETRQNILKGLNKKGLKPINIHHRAKDGSITEKLIIPGAIVTYKGTEIPLNLLLNNPGKTSDENLNNSIEALEYTFIRTIKNLTSDKIPKIAFLEGHGEWPDPFVGDMMKELSKSYQIDRGSLNNRPGILDTYEAIVIAGPVREFSETDKFIIDQYIMQGGKVLWLLDAVNVDFDSLAMGHTFALPNNINLDDMLFRYGVRLNYNLVEDAQCSFIPVNVALAGNVPDFQPVPWVYYPLINPPDDNVITKNLNMVMCRFANTIDTIEARKEIKKTPLLVTSKQVILRKVPAFIQLQEINNPPTAKDFILPPQLTGVLLEGRFESVFKNRSIKQYLNDGSDYKLKENARTKMIVIADADIIRNDVKQTPSGPVISPLGFDRYTNQTFGNKDFLSNAINYLTEEDNLLALRGRNFKIRLLNRTLVESERLKWQLFNLGLPVVIVVLAGLVYGLIRKTRYAKSK